MSKFKMLCLMMLGVIAFTATAQFMDPEKPVTKKVNTVVKKDEFFPEIIPDHGGGGQEIVVIKEEIGVISNTVEKVVEQQVIISNTVEKVVEQQTIISNTIERVEVQVNVLSNDVAEVGGPGHALLIVAGNVFVKNAHFHHIKSLFSISHSVQFCRERTLIRPACTQYRAV